MSDHIRPKDLDDPYRVDESNIVGYCEWCGGAIYKHEDWWEHPAGTCVHDDCFNEYMRDYYQSEYHRGE